MTKMKRLFLAALVILFASPLWATTTVTADLKNLFAGSLTSKAMVRFRLRNYGSNIPRVTTTGVIVQVEKDCTTTSGCVNPANGALSTSVFSNSEISPA